MTFLKALTLSLLITAIALPVCAGPGGGARTSNNTSIRDLRETDESVTDETRDMKDGESKHRVHQGDNN